MNMARWFDTKYVLYSKVSNKHTYGKDYTCTTSPTAHMESWQILLHIAACLDWDAQQINIKMPFLYGLLLGDLPMVQPYIIPAYALTPSSSDLTI